MDSNREMLNLSYQQLKRESWIKNVIRIQQISVEDAEKLYDKIKPHEQTNTKGIKETQ